MPKPSCRICELAARNLRARRTSRRAHPGGGSPVSQWRANRSSASRSQHQFSMIWLGSSTKSQATLVPARLRTSTRLSRWCIRWPNSWKTVSTSRCESRAGWPASGGVTLPQMTPTCGRHPPPTARRSRTRPSTRRRAWSRGETSRYRSRRASAVGVPDLVVAHVRVPYRLARRRDDARCRRAAGRGRRGRPGPLQGEVGPQILFVEIVLCGALLFGPVADLPRLQPGRDAGGGFAECWSAAFSAAEALDVLARRSARNRAPYGRCAPFSRPAQNPRNLRSRAAGPSRGAAARIFSSRRVFVSAARRL